MFVPLSPASPPQNYLHELRVEARLRPNGMYQSMPGQACVITQEAKLRVWGWFFLLTTFANLLLLNSWMLRVMFYTKSTSKLSLSTQLAHAIAQISKADPPVTRTSADEIDTQLQRGSLQYPCIWIKCVYQLSQWLYSGAHLPLRYTFLVLLGSSAERPLCCPLLVGIFEIHVFATPRSRVWQNQWVKAGKSASKKM
jgi:hypothetical protein